MLLVAASCEPRAGPLSLEWSVLDQTSNTTTPAPNGASLQINGGHTYIVTLRVTDPAFIREIVITGDGTFGCDTDENVGDSGLRGHTDGLRAGIDPQTTTIPGNTTTSAFGQTAPFVYVDMKCGGPRIYPGSPNRYQAYASTGTLHLKGVETDVTGKVNTATLDLKP